MKIAVLVHAHALAHVSRALEVAKALRQRGHRLVFAGDGRYLAVARKAGFPTVVLPFIPAEQIDVAGRTQRLDQLYQESQLSEYIDAELDLYRQLAPDMVLIDCRITAPTSAELASLPSVTIINVHMTLHKGIPFYRPGPMPRRHLPNAVSMIDRLGHFIELRAYDRLVMGGMHRIRKKHGLPKRFSFSMEEGDLVLFPDLPQFNPVRQKPRHAHFVGPLTWRNELSAPRLLDRLDPNRPTVYCSLGSRSLRDFRSEMFATVPEDIQLVVAAGEDPDRLALSMPRNVLVEEFINTDQLLPHCDLVVCHGGNGTIYQALAHGLPIVGVATHEEQHYGLKRVAELGLGEGFHIKKLRRQGFDRLWKAVQRALRHDGYRRTARRFQALLGDHDSAANAADRIEGFARESKRTVESTAAIGSPRHSLATTH